jgi:hypothetical protein
LGRIQSNPFSPFETLTLAHAYKYELSPLALGNFFTYPPSRHKPFSLPSSPLTRSSSLFRDVRRGRSSSSHGVPLLQSLPWMAPKPFPFLKPAPSSLLPAGEQQLHGAQIFFFQQRASSPWSFFPAGRQQPLHGQPPLCCCRALAPASSHGAEDSLRASTSPISSTSVRRPAASLRSAAAPSPPHLPHQIAPAASRRRPWPSPLPLWSPNSLSRTPRNSSSEPPSSLFVVVPAGCSTKCAASRALQQPSRSISTPLVACRRSRARCAAPSATPSKLVVRNTPLPLLLSYFCARKNIELLRVSNRS